MDKEQALKAAIVALDQAQLKSWQAGEDEKDAYRKVTLLAGSCQRCGNWHYPHC